MHQDNPPATSNRNRSAEVAKGAGCHTREYSISGYSCTFHTICLGTALAFLPVVLFLVVSSKAGNTGIGIGPRFAAEKAVAA